MTWKHLAFGTAVIASLTLGTAIYYDGNRKMVKTEDLVELLEAVAERKMALQEVVGTNTITWTNIVWSVDPSTNRYWVENGTTNGGLQGYVLKTGITVCSNSFVTTGQYFRGWSTIVSNAGRIREGFYNSYTVDDPNGILSGTYTLAEVEYDGHLARARWDGPEYWLRFKADDEHGHFWSFLDEICVNPISGVGGGSLGAGEWLWFVDPSAMHVTGNGELLVVTNIVGSKTNIVTPYFEYQARTVTNVANAVGPFNLVSQLNYIDQSIAAIIDRFVDTSQAAGGDWVSYFSLPAHTNDTSFPALSLVRAVELLGPTVGTNTVDSWGYTNAHLLVFPARGTNAAMYSNTVTYCTKEVLEARYKILQLMHTTQDSPMWWTGSNIVASGMTNTSPSWPVLNGGHGASWVTNAGECNGLDLVLAGMESNHIPMTDVTWIFPGTNWTQATTNQAPISWATFHIGTEFRSSGNGYFQGYFELYSFIDGSFVGYHPYNGEPPLTNIPPDLWTISVGYGDYSILSMQEWNRRSRLATSTPMGSWAISNAIPEYYGISMRNTNGSTITSGSGWQRMGNMQKLSTTYSPGETSLYGARKGAVISGDIAPFSVVDSLAGLTVTATVTNLVSTNWCETTGTGTGPDWIWVDLNNNGWHDSPGETFYFKEHHGGAQYWPQYKLPSTNKVITSWSVNAGPILLKWDFTRCKP